MDYLSADIANPFFYGFMEEQSRLNEEALAALQKEGIDLENLSPEEAFELLRES